MLIDGRIITQDNINDADTLEYLQRYRLEDESQVCTHTVAMSAKKGLKGRRQLEAAEIDVTPRRPPPHPAEEPHVPKKKPMEEEKFPIMPVLSSHTKMGEEERLKRYEELVGLGYTLPQVLACEEKFGVLTAEKMGASISAAQ